MKQIVSLAALGMVLSMSVFMSTSANAELELDCYRSTKTKNQCKQCCEKGSNTPADTPKWNAMCKKHCESKN